MTAVLDQEQQVTLASECRHCHEPVLRTVGAGTGTLLLLEATPRAGGLYELRPVGQTMKAARRNMIEVTREMRGIGSYGGGYDKHRCPSYRPSNP